MISRIKEFLARNYQVLFMILGVVTFLVGMFALVYIIISYIAGVDGYSFDPWLTVVIALFGCALWIRLGQIVSATQSQAEGINDLLSEIRFDRTQNNETTKTTKSARKR